MTEYSKLSILSLVLAGCASDYELKGERPNVDPGEVTDCPFIPISGTKMSQYECNPVFENTDEDWGGDVGSVGFHVTEVMGHPFYQMWYTSSASSQFGDFGVGYAVSDNGTSWNTHPNNPLFSADPTAWDQDSHAGQVVVWDPVEKEYVMAYQGFTLGDGFLDAGIWGLGIATSKDGLSWTKHPNNPVIDFTNDFNAFTSQIQPCWPLTITLNRNSFRGYIAASKVEESLFGSAACHLYSMDAFDAGNWIINESQPVMEGNTSYDQMGIASAAVVEFNEILYMFYVGFTEWQENTGYQSAVNLTLSLATSNDNGLSWQKDPNNPFPINLTTPGQVSSVGAQVIGSRIHLWVGDNYDDPSAIGYFYFEPDIEDHE